MDDDYIIEEYSDYEDVDSSSSDDEIESFVKKECGIVDIHEDFNDEMDKVINDHLKRIDPTNFLFEIEDLKNKETTSENTEKSAGSDKIVENKRNKQELGQVTLNNRRKPFAPPLLPDKGAKTELSNDDLFYDPDLDDEDQKWLDNKRRSYIYPSEDSNTKKPQRLPNSDAVLNCPACLSLLCLDCQRHELYKSQYRAMFVSNCKIITSEILNYPVKQKKLKKKSTGECSAELNNNLYNPVNCAVCNTAVAVYDSSEIYHFFNVLASFS